MERDRREHGQERGGGEAQMEKPARQVLQGEEANSQEKLPAANGRRERGGAAGAGALPPAVLAQRLRQTQARHWHGGHGRGVCVSVICLPKKN